MPRPTIGRIVHYVLANGEHRAATVVNAWEGAPEGICNLTVHLDGWNDLQPPFIPGGALSMSMSEHRPGHCKDELIPEGASALCQGILSVGSAHQDEETHSPGTWHFPER